VPNADVLRAWRSVVTSSAILLAKGGVQRSTSHKKWHSASLPAPNDLELKFLPNLLNTINAQRHPTTLYQFWET